MKIVPHFLVLTILFAFSYVSCTKDNLPPEKIEGFVPVYYVNTNSDTVTFKSPQPIEKTGKIYLKGNILYQIELYKGIHIIDLSNPDEAKSIGFYDIYGCIQLTMEGSIMYINANGSLIVMDVTIIEDPKIVTYWANYFESINFPPPPQRGYFECIDPSKGIVIDWRRQEIIKPECRYN